MVYFEFIIRPLIFIDWNQYVDSIIKEGEDVNDVFNNTVELLITDITNLINNQHMNLAFETDEVTPVPLHDNINTYINDLKTIVQFLDSNQIPWTGGIVAMTRDETPGFLAIKNVNQGYASPVAIVAYVTDDLELNKQYYPLSNVTKQI